MTTRSISALLILLLCMPTVTAAQTTDAQMAAMWRTRAAQLPIGSTVKVRLQNGEQLTAVVFDVDQEALILKPKTRVPEPSRRIAFDHIVALQERVDRVSFGKYAAIGAAIGATVFLTLLASAQ